MKGAALVNVARRVEVARPRALAVAILALFAACSAPRPPRIVAPLAYGPVAEVVDEAFRAQQPKGAPADTGPLLTSSTARLPNGMDVVLVERHNLPIVSVRLVLSRGSRDLSGPRPELLDLLGDALLRAWGASYDSGWSSDFGADGCVLSRRTTSANLAGVIARMGEMARTPRYGAAEITWLRNTQVDHWDSGSAPRNNLGALLFAANDAYAPIGEDAKKAILKTTAEDLRAMHERLFHPAHATLVVAGDATMGPLLRAAEKAFGAWTPARAAIPRSAAQAAPATAGGHAALVDYRGILVHASVIARAPGPTDADVDAMRLLVNVLASRKGRLHEEVRASQGATYSFGADMRSGRAGSWITVGGALELEKALSAMDSVVKAIRSARDHGVEESELASARARYLTSSREGAGTATTVTSMIAGSVVLGVPLSELVTRPERLARVTTADLQRAARAWLSDEKLRLVVVGPEKYIDKGFETLGIGPIEWRDWRGEVLK